MTRRILIAIATLALVTGSAQAFVLLGNKWLDPSMDVPYRISTRNEACIAGDDEFDEIRAGFQAWSDVPGTRLTFTEQPQTATCGFATDGFNTMSLDDCNNQIPSGVIAATSLLNWGGPLNGSTQGGDPTWIGVETASPQEILGLTESDIVASAVLRFGTYADIAGGCQTDACGPGNAFDLRGIMTHEIGHLIGLDHSAGTATMRPSAASCDASLTSLELDDENGARRLYDENYLAFDFENVEGGNVRSAIFNAGDLGVSGSGAQVPGQFGAGFEFPIGTQNLYEASLIFGTGAGDPVSSDYRQPIAVGQDNDFYQTTPVTLQNTFVGGNGQLAQGAFSDAVIGAEGYGVSVVATMHAWNDAPNDDFVIVCFKLTNTSGSAITGLRVGLMMDWDFNNLFAANGSTWDAGNQVGVISDPSTARRAGVAVLNGEGAQTYRTLTSADNFAENAKAGYLFDDFNNTDVASGDVNIVIATGDFDLGPNETAIASFAILGGDSNADLLTNLSAARDLYDEEVLCDVNIVGVETASVPGAPLGLRQNVPNPFNPLTRIAYDLSRAGMVQLRIHDPAGRAVRTLVAGVELPGAHSVVWDGRNDAGEKLPSGLYFYRLHTASGSVARKMMLLK